MKKILFVFATAALFAACSQNDAVAPVAQQNADDAISFSAYSTTAVTRGTVNTTTAFTNAGIGVFAFYQPAVNGVAGADFTTVKYPTPDYMYNEKISFTAGSGSAATWSYSPVKYWPNNKNDKLSFFAYAPYVSTTTWEDLGISTDATGKTITKTFDIYNDVNDQKDYLFAEPVTNKTKPTTITTDGLGKANVTDVTTGYSSANGDQVVFNFTHVTSKVNLYVGVNTDVNVSGYSDKTAAAAWYDPNTEIEIKSIEFKDLATTLTWTSSASTKWSAAGKQDIVVKPYTNTSVTPTVNYGLITKATNATTPTWLEGWHHYLQTSGSVVVPSTTSAITEPTDADDQFMFIAPQTLSTEEIVITYVVRTTDANLNGGKSEITNVITKTWNDFMNADFTGFVAGKQYRLFFLIGMQSVKVAATVTDWADATPAESVIDVPAANGN